MQLFHLYGDASGQWLNNAKCRFYADSLSNRRRMDISDLLGFQSGQLPFMYLGVPLFQGKPKKVHLQPVIDKIKCKLSNWKGKLPSIMGRVQLVKSVIHGMASYCFHVYAWPLSLLWTESQTGNLSFKEAFTHLNPVHNSSQWGKIIWQPFIPPSRSCLVWRICHHKLPTDDNIRKVGLALASVCSICGKAEESIEHLFFICPFAVRLWSWLSSLVRMRIDASNINAILAILDQAGSVQVKHTLLAAIINVLWFIWKSRNLIRFEGLKISFSAVCTRPKPA